MQDATQQTRQGGKKKSPVIVKISLDEKTSLDLLTTKPNSATISGFCAMMVEYGLKEWKKREELYQQAEDQ